MQNQSKSWQEEYLEYCKIKNFVAKEFNNLLKFQNEIDNEFKTFCEIWDLNPKHPESLHFYFNQLKSKGECAWKQRNHSLSHSTGFILFPGNKEMKIVKFQLQPKELREVYIKSLLQNTKVRF